MSSLKIPVAEIEDDIKKVAVWTSSGSGELQLSSLSGDALPPGTAELVKLLNDVGREGPDIDWTPKSEVRNWLQRLTDGVNMDFRLGTARLFARLAQELGTYKDILKFVELPTDVIAAVNGALGGVSTPSEYNGLLPGAPDKLASQHLRALVIAKHIFH